MNDAKFLTDLYIRVSTDRQAKEGDSLEEQETELKKYCEFRKFEIRNIYIERGKSGSNTNRPEYQKLIEDVKAKKIQAVIVKKIDRLSRSLLDFEEFMLLLQNNNIEFISIKESFDTTSAMGKAMLLVALIFAQLEREQTSERLTDVMAFRASQGLFNGGQPPFGYTNVEKELIPYPREKQIVEIMFEQFLDNKSITETARFLNEAGMIDRNSKLWDKRRVHYILQNQVYLGKIQWKGQVYQGIHQPIITEKRFSLVLEIIKKGFIYKKNKEQNAIFQKLLFCGYCKSPLTPCYGINRTKTKYQYYRCVSTQATEKGKRTCQQKYIAFPIIETQVFNALISLTEESKFNQIENKALKYNQEIEKEIQLLKAETQTHEIKQEEIKKKKDQYLDSLITGKFTSSEKQRISKKLDEMELEIKQLNASLSKLRYESNQKQDTKIDLIQFKQNLITFRAEKYELNRTQIFEYLQTHIEKIIYQAEKMQIKFKLMPWEIESQHQKKEV